MPVDIVDLGRLIVAIILLIIPGYLWSVLFFPKIQWFERIVFGFCAPLLGFSLLLFSLNTFASIKLTVILVWTIYWIIAIPIVCITLVAWYKQGIKETLFPIIKDKTISILKNPKTWLLLGIIIFAGLMMFLPHLRDGYFLPFHVDEWEHWILTKTAMETGSTSFVNPYLGSGTLQSMEIGFHLMTASLLWISGSQMNTVFVFMPLILGMMLSLVVFCIGNRCKPKFGLFAAFTVAFIPTTCRMMGPSFYVPVSLGLVFIAFTLWLVQQEKLIGSIILAGTVVATFVMHAPTALAELVMIFSYSILLLFKKKIRLSLLTMGIISVPVIFLLFAATRWTGSLNLVIDAFFGGSQFSAIDLNLPKIWVEFEHLSLLVWGLAALGVYFSFTGSKTTVKAISLSIFGFLSFIGLYSKFEYGLPIMYERSFLFLFLMITLLAGYTIAMINDIIVKFISQKDFIKKSMMKNTIPIVIPLIIMGLILSLSVPVHLDILYYHMISENEYDTFTWIDENIDSYRNETNTYNRAAIDPFKASPFCAISGLSIVSSTMSPIYGYSNHKKVSSFLSRCCQDEGFLNDFDVSIVYTHSCCNNTDFTMIYPNVYIYTGI